VFFHNIERPRGYLALKLFRLAERIDLFIVCARPQADFLRRYLNLPEHRVLFVWDQTDLKFFTPGAASPNKTRPLVVSVGLEKRDYRLLAEATKDLDLDVKISGFSQDASLLAQAFPETMPVNMSRQFYKWPDLVQLYRDADVIVVSLLNNSYAAGVQALMEAMACRRPVVVTRTQGLAEYISPKAITSVKPGDALELRQTIINVLNHPQEAEAKAECSYQLALERHNTEKYVEVIAQHLESL
jgi:glycosyltransferase involved in cell wall biosynthesis